jgi:RNA-directed DNA polymerase
MEQVCSVENLTLAWRRVRGNIQLARRGQSAGPDTVTVRDFEADWTRQMSLLAEELRSGAYRPLPARRVAIPKASGGTRAIAILAVRDRIAQRAVHQVLEPLFDPLFLDCSYGCRPRVGAAEAVARVARYAEQGLMAVVDADIACYFDSIDQRILLGLVRQRVDELALLQVIAQWLSVGTLAQTDAASEDARSGGAARTAPFARSRQALQRMLDRGGERDGYTPVSMAETYGAGAWGQAAPEADMPAGMWPPQPGLEQRVWTAIALAKPVLGGAQRALPYVRRLGKHPAVVAGAMAAGAAAAGGYLLQRHGSEGRGTPQGGALSPLLANIYLHPFDAALTSQGLRLVRFVDDFVIMCADQAEAERALQVARRQLAALRLELNPEKTRVAAYEDGLQFLGQALLPRRNGARLGQGLATFAEAEQALRATARKIRRKK